MEKMNYGTEKSLTGLAIYFAMLFAMAYVFRKGWKAGAK
tara:strand:- start:442 stop:558 length:117 start_codon:yes stop_codon:yes gene_type:complete